MRRHFLLIAAQILLLQAFAQQAVIEQFRTTPEKSGGVYYAYPGAPAVKPTTPPSGYVPFYISHYGRHGSRYMLSDRDYTKLIAMLQNADTAGVLTPLGKEKLAQMNEIWAEANGHTDELAPLGKRQHRGIAERMYKNYPEVFSARKTYPNSPHISARSTTSLRCCLSMVAFCMRLKELDPTLDIDWDTSKSNMYYLNYHDRAFEMAKNGQDGWARKLGELNGQASIGVTSDRFCQQIIADTTYIREKRLNFTLMQAFYDVASDLQDMETEISFYDLFTPEELYQCWVGGNLWFYTGDANSPHNKGAALACCQNLIDNIIEGADKAIAAIGKTSREAKALGAEAATLRFGHDGNIIPLAAALHLEGCDVSEADGMKACEAWQNYHVSPMAANIQLVFFAKEGSDDILVKFLLNENEMAVPAVATDVAPFYHWADIRTFLKK